MPSSPSVWSVGSWLCRALVLASTVLLAPWARAALAIEHWTEPSGARVYLVQSPAIPMLDLQIDFDGGSRRDPPTQTGLAAATAGMVSSGVAAWSGQPARDENALEEAWLDTGAQFSVTASHERFTVGLRTLTDPAWMPQALALAAQQIAVPTFAEAVWQRDRERQIAALREAEHRPSTETRRAFAQAVYGAHPYARDATAATLRTIGVDDLRDHYRRTVRTCRARVTLVGAVDRAAAQALLRPLLAAMGQGPCEPLPEVPEVAPLTAPALVELPFASAQAQVLIGQPGVARRDPDYFPLLVGNYILGGGGFVSRLTAEVREKRGLSYSVYSYFTPGLHAGAFQIGLSTRPDQARAALAVVRDELRRFVAEGPTEDELRAAKDFLVKGFALRIDSNRKLLDNVAHIAWHDLPLNTLDTWTRQVQAVTVADIRRAFQRVLQPERMATVVLGATPAP